MSNKSVLVQLFETGDVPTGANFADLINSSVNLFETNTQTMAGGLNPTELVTSRVSAGNVNVTGILSAPVIATNTFSFANLIGINLTATTASAATLYTDTIFLGKGIVSAAGSTQATATPLSFSINLIAGLADGSATGVILQSNRAGQVQYVFNAALSANLWPCVGGQINVLSSNAAFAMAASTLYTIIHTAASGYAVK